MMEVAYIATEVVDRASCAALIKKSCGQIVANSYHAKDRKSVV